MSVNLLEKLQSQLGYPLLQKIDPNTQVVKEDDKTPDEHRFSQAAIPAVLTALYSYSHTDVGAEQILKADPSIIWTNIIFSDHREEVIERIADYANYTKENVISKLDRIASLAINILHDAIPQPVTVHDVKKFMNGQRTNILPYLPAVLQMGELLHDNTLDDRTNKMEGPVSSIMQVIGGSYEMPSIKGFNNSSSSGIRKASNIAGLSLLTKPFLLMLKLVKHAYLKPPVG
jgi:hypothetical protein